MMASGIYAQDTKAKTDTTNWPRASLSGKTGAVTRADIYKSPEITIDNAKGTVTEFKMSITGKDVEYKEFTGGVSKLDEKMIAAIKNAPPHAKLYFEFIKFTDENGKSRMSRPFTIELK